MSVKMALRRFALRAAGGFRGREGAETFARELLAAFGAPSDGESGGPVFSYALGVVDDGKRSNRTLTAYWPERRVVLDVVERDTVLDLAWSDLLRACLQMDAEPQYVMLTNQRDVRLYDLARDRTEPRLSIALDEIPKYSEAFPFFERDWVPGTTPKIVNVDKVSKEVADLVAQVYRALLAKNPRRGDDVIRFTLQCIVAMFAEDIGLLPKEYFTTLLYQAAEEGDAEGKLADLFRAMSTNDKGDSAIPFFNGGLFSDPVSIKVGDAPLRALTKASEANWTFVDPHIFGSVFQGIMDDAERHASGAHYTAREDIMSVVGPTIIEPWRERIATAATLKDLRDVLSDLAKYRVLDPACGSGNFLYIAFRELYKLETEVLCRIYEFASAQKGKGQVSWASGIRATNFFGIDVNRFAVELAKTTLNIAKKIAFEERKAAVVEMFGQAFLEVDPSLPLDNLDGNVICADALFTEWPIVNAIIGNPPFLGAKKFDAELGPSYVAKLRAKFPEVTSRADFCVNWFRLAHRQVEAGARAGLIATNSIRNGESCEASLQHIVRTGGQIVSAVSRKPWPGDATQEVSIVNWVGGVHAGSRSLIVNGRVHYVSSIAPHLQLFADASEAVDLPYASEPVTEGVHFGTKEFNFGRLLAAQLMSTDARGVLHPVASGSDILGAQYLLGEEWTAYLPFDDEKEAARRYPQCFAFMRERVYPIVKRKALSRSYSSWLSSWWRPYRDRREFFELVGTRRMIACSQTMARPIFFFLSPAFRPTNKVQLFAFSDDYTFGIIQSSLHWAWVMALGGRIKKDPVYRTRVWKTFPWPQEPSLQEVVNVAQAARSLLAVRRDLMNQNGWSLRELHRSAEVAGSHPLKEAQSALDAAVESAYGKPRDQGATEFLLEMNIALAEDVSAGRSILGPGLPAHLSPSDARWFGTDCVEPPALPALEEQG